MILKVFKEKSNQKYINKTLSTRKVAVNDSKVQTIGVILNSEEFSDFEAFRKFFKRLQLKPNETKIITMLQDSLGPNENLDTYFSLQDFGWKGQFKNLDLQTFVDQEFDLLIGYYKTQHIELNMITAASKASFKVGLSNEDQRYYDLIIDCEPTDFSTFIIELNKYLTVLNKI
jgi:hypothetical protein